MKKPMTIEDLAQLMNDRFEKQDSKMDSGFKHIGQKFERLDKNIENLDKKLESEIEKLASMTVREFALFDEKLDRFKIEVTNRFDNMDKRFNDIEAGLVTTRYSLFTLDERFVSRAEFERYVKKNPAGTSS